LFLMWFVLSMICTACFLHDLFCLWYVLLVSYMICFVFDMYCLFLIWFVLSVICTACFLYDFFCLWYVLLVSYMSFMTVFLFHLSWTLESINSYTVFYISITLCKKRGQWCKISVKHKQKPNCTLWNNKGWQFALCVIMFDNHLIIM
jgi:hypothetical protein